MAVMSLIELAKVSTSTIEELVRFGLLDPRGGLFGFRDLASARQISKLFAQGIALSEIIRSVNEVRQWLPQADLSNLRLHPAAYHDIEVEQPGGRTDKRGQFVLPVRRRRRSISAICSELMGARLKRKRLCAQRRALTRFCGSAVQSFRSAGRAGPVRTRNRLSAQGAARRPGVRRRDVQSCASFLVVIAASAPKSVGENKRRASASTVFDLVAWWTAENAICRTPRAVRSNCAKLRASKPRTFA